MMMQKIRNISPLRQTVSAALLMGVFTLLLPLLLFGGTGYAGAEPSPAQPVLPATPSPVPRPSASASPSAAPSAEPVSPDGARTVRVLHSDGSVSEDAMADYLWSVVAAEMPASFEPDALKAQAAAARTYALWKILSGSHQGADVCTDYACCQAWIAPADAEAMWGEDASFYAARISEAVSATDGQVLCYDGQPIQAVFHASSAGRTEDAVTVWGNAVPYLTGVSTPEGDEVPGLHSTVVLSAGEVRACLEPLGCRLSDDPALWFDGLTYSDGGSVASALVGGVSLRGTALRTALGLRSAAFSVNYADGSFTFSVSGHGHGVGMSQYGANAMALAGSTWEEIVLWYYPGAELRDSAAF